MKLSSWLTAVFVSSSFACALPLAVANGPVLKDPLLQFDHVKREVNLLEDALQLYRREGMLDGLVELLIPILEPVLVTLTQTGLTPVVLDMSMANPEMINFLADGVIWVLRNDLIDLTDLIIGLQRSGMIMDVLHLSLEDPAILPGLIRIATAYMALPLTDDSYAEAPPADQYTAPPADQYTAPPTGVADDGSTGQMSTRGLDGLVELFARESVTLNQVLGALNSSGLARQFVQHLLTTPELAEPAAMFVKRIVDLEVLSLNDVVQAFMQANIVGDLIGDLMADTALIAQFGNTAMTLLSGGLSLVVQMITNLLFGM